MPVARFNVCLRSSNAATGLHQDLAQWEDPPGSSAATELTPPPFGGWNRRASFAKGYALYPRRGSTLILSSSSPFSVPAWNSPGYSSETDCPKIVLSSVLMVTRIPAHGRSASAREPGDPEQLRVGFRPLRVFISIQVNGL